MSTDAELAALTALLDLDEFEVVAAAADRAAGVRRLTVAPRAAAGLCPHCGRACDERHACHDREALDLPLGGWKTLLVVRLWQFRCDRCDRFFTPRHPALAEGAHATERLLDRLADLASHADLAAAARFFGVPEKTAEGWYYDHLGRLERRRQSAEAGRAGEGGAGPEPVRSLGVDELSLKKSSASSSAC